MPKTFRASVKHLFDRAVYTSPALNRIARNVNKLIAPLTSFRLRPSGVLHLRFKSGLRFLMATNESSAVAKKIFWQSPDRYEYSSVFEKLVAKCSVFADIGASIGYYSLLAARANPNLRVFAFEPAAAPFYFLKKNISLNNLGQRIEAFAIALSNATGEIKFHELQSADKNFRHLGGTGRIVTEGNKQPDAVEVMVAAETLDLFFAGRARVPDLIKMDTEGTEYLVLEGAASVLQTHKPIIICETLFNVIEPVLDRIMRAHGYHFYNFQDGALSKVETLVRSADNHVSDCFFVHPEKEHLIREFIKRT